MERHPRESVQRHLGNPQMQKFCGGFVYIFSGDAL
jgi:hypothetical protein